MPESLPINTRRALIAAGRSAFRYGSSCAGACPQVPSTARDLIPGVSTAPFRFLMLGITGGSSQPTGTYSRGSELTSAISRKGLVRFGF